MKTRNLLLPVATAGILAITLSACGGGGGGTTSGSDAASQGLDGRGPITYVQGKDNSNVVRPLIDKWNAAHPNEKVTFKEQTDQADQQHDDLVQHFQAKDPGYDARALTSSGPPSSPPRAGCSRSRTRWRWTLRPC